MALTGFVKRQIHERVKPRVVLLTLSLAANVVLGSVILRPRSAPDSVASETTETAPPRIAAAAVEPTSESQVFVATKLLPSPEGTPEFHWSQLESEDYREYIARLRAFGVRERVVRDIIIAEIQKLYRPRFAALRPKNPNFWETRRGGYSAYQNMTAEQREQMRLLQREQQALVKELLGDDVYEAIARDSGQPDWTERMLGPIPKELREKVLELQQRFQEAQAEIRAKAEGYIDEEARTEIAALRRKMREDLAKILSPEQLEEYELRNSEIAQQMRWELGWFEPSENEFRAIHSAKQIQEEIASLLRPEVETNETTREQVQALSKKREELNKALEELLGSERWKEYQLNEQWEYRSLFEAGVPRSTVVQVSEMRGEIDQAVAALHQNKSLTVEQRNAALLELKAETQRTLEELLGPRRAKHFSNSTYWLRNLVPPTRNP